VKSADAVAQLTTITLEIWLRDGGRLFGPIHVSNLTIHTVSMITNRLADASDNCHWKQPDLRSHVIGHLRHRDNDIVGIQIFFGVSFEQFPRHIKAVLRSELCVDGKATEDLACKFSIR
jgi:hypothetical protein